MEVDKIFNDGKRFQMFSGNLPYWCNAFYEEKNSVKADTILRALRKEYNEYHILIEKYNIKDPNSQEIMKDCENILRKEKMIE